MDNIVFSEVFKKRTQDYAFRISRLYKSISGSIEGQLIGKQLLRSGTSVAANYRAACRARSHAEYISKMSIVAEEADESVFWIELLTSMEIISPVTIEPLLTEANEILSIVSKASKTAQIKK